MQARLGRVLPLVVALAGLGTGTAVAAKTDAGVAARVGDKTFTLSEVDREAQKANLKAYQELYDVRKAAIDSLVGDYLLDQEAKRRGVSTERLIEAEIESKIQPVTDADAEAWFEQNKARMRGRTLESVKDQIKSFLATTREQEARSAFLNQLKAQTSIQVLIDPPRIPVEVAKNDPRKGPATAPITIVEFSDFQ